MNIVNQFLSATSEKEVDDLVEENIDCLITHPDLRVFPVNAYKRIALLKKTLRGLTPIQYLN